jgi:hypothetical protein
MASSSKKRTTMAKLNRESKLREKREEKEARKARRKLAEPEDSIGPANSQGEFSVYPEPEPELEPVAAEE